METPFYFISYSRTQLYFAESVAVHLERMKVNVWFDLQQLKTGETWANEIKHGLDECAGVILIVSQQSMKSKYVESEWKAALDAGKPVYLVYFEPAELTDERLQSCPAIDGRGRFKAAMRQLSRTIKGEESPHEGARFWKVRPPRRLARFLAADDDGVMRFPTKLALGVLMITLSLLAISLTLLLAMLMVAILFGIPFSLWLGVIAGFGCLASSHYVRRKLIGPPPRFFVLIALFGMIVLVFMTFSYPAQQKTMIVLTLITALFAAVFGLAFILRGGDILRWTLTGFANEKVRRRYHGGRWVRRAGKGNHAITYRVLHSRGDEKFAKRLLGEMSKYGHVLTSDPDDQPDQFTFFLLSNLTVWDEVRTALKAYPRLIAAAMTTVTLPQDVKDQMGRFQYLDARTDAGRRFRLMAASLTETQVQSSTLSASIETTPANLDMTVIPQRVQVGLGSLRLYATVGFVAPLLVVLQLTILRSSGMDAQFSTPTVIVTVIAALLFALFCFSLDYLVRFRQITTRVFMAVYAVGMILFSLVSSVFGGIQIFGQGTSTDPLSVIPAIIIFFFTSAGLFAWLPAVPPHKLSLSDVRAQFGSVLRNVLVIGVIGVYAAFVIITAGFLGGAGMAQVLSGNIGLTGAAAPVFSAWITFGNLTVRYPQELNYLSLTNGQIDFNTFSSFNGGKDVSLRAPIQMIVDQLSQEMGDLFSPLFAGYALDSQGSGLTLIGGQFTPPAEADSPNYARQRLYDLAQGESERVVYEPEHTFGSEASPIPGALVELKSTDESGTPVLVTIAAIDTATAHHLIYLVSSDTPAMRALRDQFFALLQSSS